jgi:hypothetical protein
MFRFVQWHGFKDTFRKWGNGRRAPFVFYHRLANAGRLQLGPLSLMWPLPWADAVKHLPGYGFDKPSGVMAAMGWKQPQRSDPDANR